MKLRDTNEPRQRTNCANGNHGRTDGHTDVRIDGRMNGRTDSPTFRTNWSYEILGEPKKDSGIFAEKRRRSAQANDKRETKEG